MKHSAKHIEKKLTEFLANEPEIIAAYLYGSFAKSSSTPLSDIDIAILTNKEFNTSTVRLDYELALEQKISEQIAGEKIEVRLLNNAPIIIQGKIITEGKLLFSNNDKKIRDFEEYVIMHYLDFKVVYDDMLEKSYNQLIHGR
jgi:predicted nucleotidyltransferase